MSGLPNKYSTIVSPGTAATLNLGATAAVCPPDSQTIAQHPVKQISHLYYGLYQTGTVPFLLQATPPLTEEHSMLDAASPCPVWWTVNLWALEITRQVIPNGNSTLPPLPLSTVMADGRRFSRLKARISWENVLANSIDVDIGTGICLSLLANSLRVSLLVPPSFRLSTDRGGQELGPGNIVDSKLAVSAYQSESPVGEKSATFTQYVIRPADNAVAQNIPVPPAAKFVTIYEAPSSGTNNLQWIQHNPTSAVPCGEIIFPTARLVERIAVPQNADTLRIPAAAEAADRGWNITWHLRF